MKKKCRKHRETQKNREDPRTQKTNGFFINKYKFLPGPNLIRQRISANIQWNWND